MFNGLYELSEFFFHELAAAFLCGECIIFHRNVVVDSVYLRSSQNSQPNSDASDMNSRKKRGSVFRIARSDPSPAF